MSVGRHSLFSRLPSNTYCDECGAAVSAVFCEQCGTKIAAVLAVPVAEVAAPVAEVAAPVAEIAVPVAEVPAPVAPTVSGTLEEKKAETIHTLLGSWAIPYSNLSFFNQLGSGAFGNVYGGKLGSKNVAIKVLGVSSPAVDLGFFKECGMLRKISELNIPNVIKFEGAGYNPLTGSYHLVTGLCSEDLWTFVNSYNMSSKWVPRGDCYKIACDIASGCVGLHAHGIVHRDLKLENVLLSGGDSSGGYKVNICDFGLSIQMGPGEEFVKREHKEEPPIGTLKYLAPEILFNPCVYSPGSDIYALGCVLYILFSQRSVYSEMKREELEPLIKANIKPDMTKSIPLGVQAIIKRCWAHNSSDRPTSSQVYDELTRLSRLP